MVFDGNHADLYAALSRASFQIAHDTCRNVGSCKRMRSTIRQDCCQGNSDWSARDVAKLACRTEEQERERERRREPVGGSMKTADEHLPYDACPILQMTGD